MHFYKSIISLFTISLIFLSFSFVQPLQLLLSNTADKTGAWKSMKVSGYRTVTNVEKGQKYREDFILNLKRPLTAKIQLTNSVTGKTRKTSKFSKPVRRMLDIILLSNHKAKLYGKLKAWGVAGEIIGLTRLDKKVCQIIGALETQPDKNQFWVEKFDYFPARLIYVTEGDDKYSRVQISMTGWDSPITDEFFPKNIEISENGKILQKWEITGINLSASKK